ncbi:hypothetical protein ACIQ7Q_16625 [Streptomyces sp. NPDC096176]|uniref:hypothetical protein n=1 Tax=Streptomyces sp. NPDC096176 TaxID=3366079 RepID=UPI0038188C4D
MGETKARAEELFHLSASFGPFAQARYPDSGTGRGAGGSKDHFWATATCSGSGAYFTIHATEYVHVDDRVEDFVRSALTAFAKRSAEQHGCTDLKLPR